MGHTKNPNYCHYHRFISNPIQDFFVLKDKIQALAKSGVLCLNKEMKKVITYIVSLQFGKELPKVKVHNGVKVSKMIM